MEEYYLNTGKPIPENVTSLFIDQTLKGRADPVSLGTKILLER